MRDVNRIDIVCAKLAEQWKRVPDWRFSQLMSNLTRAAGDLFYVEDDKFVEYVESFLDSVTGGKE